MVLECLQKNTAEHLLTWASASKNSAGNDVTINSTPKLKREPRERQGLRKELLMKNVRGHLARLVTAFYDGMVGFAHMFSAENVNSSWRKSQHFGDWETMRI